MRSLGRKIGILAWAAILGVAIALIPQGVWSALILANLRTGASIPWAVAAGALSVVALDGLWIVMARMVRMPGSVLPDM